MAFFSALHKRILFFSIFFPIATLADTSASLFSNNQYAIGVDLGIGKPTNLGSATTFSSGYSTFSYSSNTNNSDTFISGISISKLFTLDPFYTLQVGGSVHHISNMNVTGNLEQGISAPYYQSTYSYSVSSYQYLVDAKLSRQWVTDYFPYVYLGLGMASNTAHDYSTTVPDYLTVTPDYSNNTTNSFSYSVGVGVDYFVKPKLSIGLGYRFIDLGKVELGSGVVRNTNVGVQLSQSNLYMNALFAQLTYYL